MLKKLLKNEFKATSRVYIAIYLVFTALMTVERLSLFAFGNVQPADSFLVTFSVFLVGIVSTLTVLGVIALCVTPIIYGIYRFYKNMLSDEGYLSFTLPVTVSQHLWSKVIASCVWTVVSIIFGLLVGGLFLASLNWHEAVDTLALMGRTFGLIIEDTGIWFFLTALLMLFAALLQLSVSFLTYFSAMSIGQCANKHKFLVSVAVYVGFNIAASVIMQFLSLSVMFLSRGGIVERIYAFLNRYLFVQNPSVQTCQAMCILFLTCSVWVCLIGLVHFYISKYFLTKKLNLA